MPIYRYECCGREWETIRVIAERHRETCTSCNRFAALLPPTRILTFKSYYDKALGEEVTSPRHKQRLMKRHDLIEVGNEMKNVPDQGEASIEHHKPTQKEFDDKVREVKERLPDHAGQSIVD